MKHVKECKLISGYRVKTGVTNIHDMNTRPAEILHKRMRLTKSITDIWIIYPFCVNLVTEKLL